MLPSTFCGELPTGIKPPAVPTEITILKGLDTLT